MANGRLHLEVRTPNELALSAEAVAIRVPTESGQVGLRPGAEAMELAVEAGIVLVRTEEKTSFVGTAGGLLRSNGREAVLVTPLAIVGESGPRILSELHEKLEAPSSEMQARARLGKLEERILDELRRESEVSKAGRGESP